MLYESLYYYVTHELACFLCIIIAAHGSISWL